MKYLVFDDKDGVILQFDYENGLAFGIKLSDDSAQSLVNIIQNKLNERF